VAETFPLDCFYLLQNCQLSDWNKKHNHRRECAGISYRQWFQTGREVKWYKIITLKSGYAMTDLKFLPNTFKMIEECDLNGQTIYSISLSDSPYLKITDCDPSGKQCKTTGYLKDYTDVIA
jgi:hypothetical protein